MLTDTTNYNIRIDFNNQSRNNNSQIFDTLNRIILFKKCLFFILIHYIQNFYKLIICSDLYILRKEIKKDLSMLGLIPYLLLQFIYWIMIGSKHADSCTLFD